MSTDTRTETASWDGRRLGDRVALITWLAPAPQKGVIAAAAAADQAVWLSGAKLPAFVSAHRHSQLIYHDAAQLFRLVRHNDDAKATLLQLAGENRLIDVFMMANLSAQHETSQSESLRNLLRSRPSTPHRPRAGVAETGVRLFNPIDRTSALTDAAWYVRLLYARGSRWMDGALASDEVVQGQLAAFGPLGLSIEVRGALVAEELNSARLEISQQGKAALARRCAAEVAIHAESERADSGRQNRSPQNARSNNLLGWLRDAQREIVGQDGVFLPPIHFSKNDLPKPSEFGCVIDNHLGLNKWAIDCALEEALAIVQSDGATVALKYRSFPRIEPYHTPLLRRLWQGVFEPPQDRRFVALRLPQVSLRCFAATLGQTGESRLQAAYLRGQDPVAQVAALVETKTVFRDRAATAIATAVLEGMAMRLSTETIGQSIPVRLSGGTFYSDEDMSDQITPVSCPFPRVQTEALIDGAQELFPELIAYRRDTTAECIAAHFEISLELFNRYVGHQFSPTKFRRSLAEVEKLEYALTVLNELKSQTGHPTPLEWSLEPSDEESEVGEADVYVSDGEAPPLSPRRIVDRGINIDAYSTLFAEEHMLRTGRSRGRVLFSEQTAAHLDLADSVFKEAAFAALKCGYALMAVGGAEIVLLTTEQSSKEELIRQVDLSAGRLIASIPLQIVDVELDYWPA